MVWVDKPNFFCAFSETLTDMVKALVHTSLLVPGYGYITKIPDTGPGLPHTLDSLNVIKEVQGGSERQHQVFDSTVRALK